MSQNKWKMEKVDTCSIDFHHVNSKECPFGTIPKATREKSMLGKDQICKNGCVRDIPSTVAVPSLQEARHTQLKILEYLKIVVENQRAFERQITSKVKHLESKNTGLQKYIQEICMKLDLCVTSTKLGNRTNKLSELEPEQQQRKTEETMRVEEAKQFEQTRQNSRAKQTNEVKETKEQQQTTKVKETEEQQQIKEVKETEEYQIKEARDTEMSQANCVVLESSENMSKKDDIKSWLIVNREFMAEQVGALPEAEELQNHQGHQKSVVSTESTCSGDMRQHSEGCEESCKEPHAHYSLNDFILEDTSSTSSSSDFDQMSFELCHLAGVDPALTSPNQKWTIQTEKKAARKKKHKEEEEEVSESEDSNSCLSLGEVEVETKESELLQAQFKLKELQALAEVIKELLTEMLQLKESLVLIPQCLKSPIQTSLESQTQKLPNQEMKMLLLQSPEKHSHMLQNSEIKIQTTQVLKREAEILMNLGSQARNLQALATQISQILGNQAQSFQGRGTQIFQISDSQAQHLVEPDTQVTDTQVLQILGNWAQIQKPAHATQAAETEGNQAQVLEGTEHLTKTSENTETQVQLLQKMDNQSQVSQKMGNQTHLSQKPEEQFQASQTLEGQDQASKIPENQIKESQEKQAQALHPPEIQGKAMQMKWSLIQESPEKQAQALHLPEIQGKVMQMKLSQIQESPEKQAQELYPSESLGKVMWMKQSQIQELPEKQAQALHPPEIQGKVMQMKQSQIQESPEKQAQALHPPENQEKAVQTKDSQTEKLSEKQVQMLHAVLRQGKVMESQTQESPEKQAQAQALHPPESQEKVMQATQSQTQESETHRLHLSTPLSQTSQAQTLQMPNITMNSQTPKVQAQSTQPPGSQSWAHKIHHHPQYMQEQSPYKPKCQSHYKSAYLQWQPHYQDQHQFTVMSPAGNPPKRHHAIPSQNHYEPWEVFHQRPKSRVTPYPESQGLSQPFQSQVPVSQSKIVHATTNQNHHEPWKMFHSPQPNHSHHRPQPDHSRSLSLAQPTQSPQSRVDYATTSQNHQEPWETCHRPRPDHSRGQNQVRPPQPPHHQPARSPGVPPIEVELSRDGARARDPGYHFTGPTIPQDPLVYETKRQCPFCSLQFQVATSSAQKLFEDHVENHLGYVCPICSLAFRRQDHEKYVEHTGSHNHV